MRLILPQLADRCLRSGLHEGKATGFASNRNMDGTRMSTIRAPYEIFADLRARAMLRCHGSSLVPAGIPGVLADSESRQQTATRGDEGYPGARDHPVDLGAS
jgi:hypothetical protein